VKVGIFSDVHGNAEALKEVLKTLQDEKVDLSLCVGDLVGYGPEPNHCVELVTEFTSKIVAGNHDYAAIGLADILYFNIHARQAILWTQNVLTEKSKKDLRSLPMTLTEGDITCVHASPDEPEKWNYILSYEDARVNFQKFSTPICIIGHSHIPVAFIKDETGKIEIQKADEISIEPDKSYIINVGSVGQPRDGDPRSSFGIMDTEEKRFRLMRTSYPVEKVQEKMKKHNLPSYLIDRLSKGQ
jgi:predicted phosphodiesterase